MQAITGYVNNRLSFGYGYARASRTAAQTHDERVGVWDLGPSVAVAGDD